MNEFLTQDTSALKLSRCRRAFSSDSGSGPSSAAMSLRLTLMPWYESSSEPAGPHYLSWDIFRPGCHGSSRVEQKASNPPTQEHVAEKSASRRSGALVESRATRRMGWIKFAPKDPSQDTALWETPHRLDAKRPNPRRCHASRTFEPETSSDRLLPGTPQSIEL